MAKRYSEEWKKNVSEGVKRTKKPISDETRRKLSEAATRGNLNRKDDPKPFEELKSFDSIKKRVINERGRKCEVCGWAEVNPFNGIIPVQVNHKDGNNTNNKKENLEIVCPNCHSLTEHFMFYGKSHKGTWGKKGTKRYR